MTEKEAIERVWKRDQVVYHINDKGMYSIHREGNKIVFRDKDFDILKIFEK